MAVYFIRAGEDGPVKIGFARDVRRRLSTLQTSSAVDLRIIRLIKGSRETERNMHIRYAAHAVRREWFEFVEDMLTVGEAVPFPEIIRKNARAKFHPLVEEIIRAGSYSSQVIKQWQLRGVPYRICCRAFALAHERGLPNVNTDLSDFRRAA